MIISKDTTWASGRTINLTSDVQIAPGVMLTIEPGVTVNGGGFKIEAFGHLVVQGTADNRSVFNNVHFDYVDDGYIQISHAYLNGGTFRPSGLYDGAFSLTDSIIVNLQEEISIWVPSSDSFIERNIFVGSPGIETYVNAVLGGDLYVRNNVFFEQTRQWGNAFAIENIAAYDDAQVVVEFNSFLSTDRVAIALGFDWDEAAIIARNNFFNTTDPSIINAMILDRADNLHYASYIDASALNKPHPDTPRFVYGGAGNDKLSGSKYGETLYGSDGNDVIDGRAGSDVLLGGDGDDTLKGGAGNDILFGGAGNDTASYAGASAAVTVSLSRSSSQNTGAAGFDWLISIENLVGGNGNDSLTGNKKNNTLNGGAGSDTMQGGKGNDTYIVDHKRDTVIEAENAGTDTVRSSVSYTLVDNVENLILTGSSDINGSGNALKNVITGNSGNNTLVGKDGNDTLIGLGGSDVLNGGAGADRMEGGKGNDTYIVDNVSDRVIEARNAGTDTVRSSVSYALTDNVENLVLTGSLAINGNGNALNNVITGNSGSNKLDGKDGNDTLIGGGGSDILIGRAGNDVLFGGTGNDTLTGGAGRDAFVFNTKLHAKKNVDTITDFSVLDDTIRLDNAIFTALTAEGKLAAGRFVIGNKALDANDNIIYNSATGSLLYDPDGNGKAAAIKFAMLDPGLALTNADFVII
jgi:Ca2+-binding RTX toxin-like protein